MKHAASRLGAVLLGAFGSCLFATSCSTLEKIASLDFIDLPDSRVANLEALHSPSGGHRYTAQMVGDIGFVAGQQNWSVAGVQLGRPPSEDPTAAREETFENPAEKCLELLTELLDFDSGDRPRLACLQVAWCARLAAEDPSVLTRERAVLGMGPLGARVDFDRLLLLAPETPRAGPEEVAELLSDLLGAARAEREGMRLLRGGEVPDLAEAITAVRETTFDIDGARRVLAAVGALLQGTGEGNVGYAELLELAAHLQRQTIGLGLGVAVADESPVVRAAVARAAVEAGGDSMLARFMNMLTAERDPRALRPFFQLLIDRGLPERPEELSEDEYVVLRERWLDGIVAHAVENPDSTIRVKAMQALGRITEDGPGSLREEDWEAWWYERIDRKRAELGLEPIPDAVGETEGDSP